MADETKYGKYFASGPKEPQSRQRPPTGCRDPSYGLTTTSSKRELRFFVPSGVGACVRASITRPAYPQRPGKSSAVLGTNPDDPFDLEGAEMSIHAGPRWRIHTITKSDLIYVPANFLHCPMHYRNVEKVTHPIIFIQAQYSPKLNEKSFQEARQGVGEGQNDLLRPRRQRNRRGMG